MWSFSSSLHPETPLRLVFTLGARKSKLVQHQMRMMGGRSYRNSPGSASHCLHRVNRGICLQNKPTAIPSKLWLILEIHFSKLSTNLHIILLFGLFFRDRFFTCHIQFIRQVLNVLLIVDFWRQNLLLPGDDCVCCLLLWYFILRSCKNTRDSSPILMQLIKCA